MNFSNNGDSSDPVSVISRPEMYKIMDENPVKLCIFPEKSIPKKKYAVSTLAKSGGTRILTPGMERLGSNGSEAFYGLEFSPL